MCEEKLIPTKVCVKCGRTLPVTSFHKHGRSKDGYTNICTACKANKNGHSAANCNPKLAEFTPRELIDELKNRGYKEISKSEETLEEARTPKTKEIKINIKAGS